MRDHAAQGTDRGFQLLQRRRIFLGGDHVDLLRQFLHRHIDADQVLGSGEAAQRLADIHQPALEAGERGGIDTGFTAVIDALRQCLDLDLKRFNSAPRQCLGQRAADLGEIGAQSFDCGFEFTRRPQRLDPRRDLPQLPLEAAEIGCRACRILGCRTFARRGGAFSWLG